MFTPTPSKAARPISGSSPKNYRGFLIDHERNVELKFESKLEHDTLLLWLASSKISLIQEQPPAIEYYDDDGVFHHHFFDFYAETKDSRRYLVDVKPTAFVESSDILKVQQWIREQHGSAIADRMLLRTEQHAHPDDVADAKLLLRACRIPSEDADQAVLWVIEKTSGWLLIRDIVAATGLEGAAFNAIMRMVRYGGLIPRGDRRLSYDAYVRRRGSSAQIEL